MGKGKNGECRSVDEMSNKELLGNLKRVTIFSSKNEETARLANSVLKELGLPRSKFKDDFEMKSYRDKLYAEAVKRKLLEKVNIDSWYNPSITEQDVLDKVEMAYYEKIHKCDGIPVDGFYDFIDDAKKKIRALDLNPSKKIE